MEDLKGMTLNERLFALKAFDAFDKAIKSNDTNSAKKILEQCGLTYSSAIETIKLILNDPERYGY